MSETNQKINDFIRRKGGLKIKTQVENQPAPTDTGSQTPNANAGAGTGTQIKPKRIMNDFIRGQ